MKKKKAGDRAPDIRIRKEGKTAPGKKPGEMEIVAVIPLRSHTVGTIDMNETLVRYCADSLRESRHIKRVVITADDPELAGLVGGFSNARVVMRPASLSRKSVRVSEVLGYTLEKLEEEGYVPDVIVPAEITYPFRPAGIFDTVIETLLSSDFDTVIAGFAEYRVCWKKEGDRFVSITDLEKPRSERAPLHIGLPSLACATYPGVVRKGLRYGEKIGIYEIDDPFASIEVRTRRQLELVAKRLYWAE